MDPRALLGELGRPGKRRLFPRNPEGLVLEDQHRHEVCAAAQRPLRGTSGHGFGCAHQQGGSRLLPANTSGRESRCPKALGLKHLSCP